MNLIRATLDGLAKFLGAEPHQAEVVYSERSARAAFSRRGLFKAAGAVAAGTLFADVAVDVVDPCAGYELRLTSYPQLWLNAPDFVASTTPEFTEEWDHSRGRYERLYAALAAQTLAGMAAAVAAEGEFTATVGLRALTYKDVFSEESSWLPFV